MKNLIKNKKIQLLLIFLISFSFFLFLQFSTPNLFGNDTFYHIKCADLIRSNGVIKDFPWLKFTILHDSQYVDHHFLFHLFLVPFLSLGLIIGPKIACALSASLIFILFFLLLDSQKIKAKFLWTTILLFGSYPFILRLNLIRAQNLSLIFLILGLFFIFKRKYLWLGIISFFYVWLFDGFILLPFLALLYFLIERRLKPAATSLLGMTLGLIINPYFPKNIHFLLVHLGKVITSPVSIPKGGEWYPLEFSNVLGFLIPFLLFVVAIVFIFISRIVKKEDIKKERIQKIYFLGLASIVMFIATILSQRFIEYFIPLSILFSAFCLDYYFKQAKESKSLFYKKIDNLFYLIHDKLTKEQFKLLLKNKVFPILLGLFVFVLTFFIFNVQKSTKTLVSTSPYDKYKEASEWLIQNTEKGSIIFNINWDDFPQLFFWNDRNFYIVGLDPTFMYEYSKNLWKKYRNIEDNLDKTANIIKKDFDSEYVFLSERNKGLAEKLDEREDFKKVYEDGNVKIYKLKN